MVWNTMVIAEYGPVAIPMVRYSSTMVPMVHVYVQI
jgi:hypothetical protein